MIFQELYPKFALAIREISSHADTHNKKQESFFLLPHKLAANISC